MNTSLILKPSHFLKPSHPGQLLPPARRQDPTPESSPTQCITCKPRKKHERAGDSHSLSFSQTVSHSQALSFSQTVSRRKVPTPCASPRLPACKVTYAVHHMQSKKKTRANRRFSFPLIFSNSLTPDSSYPLRVARTPYLQGHVPSASRAKQEKNTSEPAILIPSHFLKQSHILKHSHFLKPSHAGKSLPRARRQDSPPARSRTQCITCKPRKKHERTGDSHSLSFSQTVSRQTAPTPCASPGLPICKVMYPVHHVQSKKKTRANRRFSFPLIFSNSLTPARPSSPPTPEDGLH